MSNDGIVIKGKRYNAKDRVRADRTDELYKDIPEGSPLMNISDLQVTYKTEDSETVAVENFSLTVNKG